MIKVPKNKTHKKAEEFIKKGAKSPKIQTKKRAHHSIQLRLDDMFLKQIDAFLKRKKKEPFCGRLSRHELILIAIKTYIENGK